MRKVHRRKRSLSKERPVNGAASSPRHVHAKELRRLDPDEVYQDALVTGLRKCTVSRQTATEAIRAGKAPSVAEAERTAARLRRAAMDREDVRRDEQPAEKNEGVTR